MILQYEMNNKEVYREGKTITYAEIVAVGKRFEDIYSVLDFSEQQIKHRPERVEVSSDSLWEKEKIQEMQYVKMIILEDSADKKKNDTLLFAPDVNIYLLNENGKTLKRF